MSTITMDTEPSPLEEPLAHKDPAWNRVFAVNVWTLSNAVHLAWCEQGFKESNHILTEVP